MKAHGARLYLLAKEWVIAEQAALATGLKEKDDFKKLEAINAAKIAEDLFRMACEITPDPTSIRQH